MSGEKLQGTGTVHVSPAQGGWRWSCSCGKMGWSPSEDTTRSKGMGHQSSHESAADIQAQVDARNAENHHRALLTALAFGRERLYQTNVSFKAAIDQMVPIVQVLVDAIAERSLSQAELFAREVQLLEENWVGPIPLWIIEATGKSELIEDRGEVTDE